jgi:5'-nucleotidase
MSNSMPRILVTNDDGYFSPGIEALAAALRAIGEVIVVAPHAEASAVGHSLTLRRPLRIEKISPQVYSVDGTPTDCVNIAIDEIMEERPDLVVSGINKGLNVGDDVTYSGTVAGAFEAALLGFPGIAVSLERGENHYTRAAEMAAKIASTVLDRGLPYRTFLNVNVPRGEFKGIRTTVQARRNHITKVDRRMDPRQRPYFWIEEAQDDWAPHDRSDRQAIKDGFVSVTPLQPDLTDHAALDAIDKLLEGVTTGVR